MQKFPSIEQFRTVVKNVQFVASHEKDGTQKNIIKYPTLRFFGTVKLHGTNSGIIFHKGKISYQSRNYLIDPSNDNAGFAAKMSQYGQSSLKDLIGQLSVKGYHIETADNSYVTFYGEWCGKGIMKGVGISQLPKMFVIFAISIMRDEKIFWVPIEHLKGISLSQCGIYNIYDFKTWEMDIDFEKPNHTQNQLVEITNEVEAECPVAKHFGVSGIGEGVVWRSDDTLSNDVDNPGMLMFKVKGKKHSESKVKILAEVDLEKLKTVDVFTDLTVTEERMLHGIAAMEEQHLDVTDIRNMGIFLKWLVSDIFKEEMDRLKISGLSQKDVSKNISNKGRGWYQAYITEKVFGT